MTKLKIILIVIILSLSACSRGSAPRPAPAPRPTIPPDAKIGSIVVSQTQIEEVFTVDTIELPNCAGSSELTVRRTFSQEIERRVNIGGFKVGFNVDIPVLEAKIAGFIETPSDQINTTIKEDFEVEMKAAPGSTVTYEIEWLKVSMTGVVELSTDTDAYFQEFTVPSALKAHIREPKQTPCQAATATP